MKLIDLRSDTVTQPGAAMRQAMAQAEVGDDVFGDDPTVKKLEALGATMLGSEAAMFATSGTQTNLCALLTHCGRGDEYLVGQQAHTYIYEGGGAAALGGIQPQTLDQEADGTLDLDKVASLIKPDDYHFAKSRLLCLENTTWGKVLPTDYLGAARQLADERSLGLHLDGARIFNAAIASGQPASTIASHFDSISVCLSKGLGAPVGSLLCGSVDFVNQAKRWRKMVGGGLRQSGIIAAAGIYALENHVDRLGEDHANAARLGEGLSPFADVKVATNMVFATFPEEKRAAVGEACEKESIRILPGDRLRLVTHLDVTAEDIERVIEVVGRA